MKTRSGCKGCRFSQLWHDNVAYACHRFPPQLTRSGTWWPMVTAEEWCGEFQPKDSAHAD